MNFTMTVKERETTMPVQTTIEFDDLLLESDVFALMEKLEAVSSHIYATVPNEILLTPSGEANIRTRWGAVYHHVRMARATLKAFVE